MVEKNDEYYRYRVSRVVSDRTGRVFRNPSRSCLIEDAVDRWMAIRVAEGTLVTWTPRDSTGRSPRDTYIVRRAEVEDKIDWEAPNSIPMDPETFDMLFEDALYTLGKKDRLYELPRVIGADSQYCLPVRTVTYNALAGLFIDNMFRPVPKDVKRSCFADKPFTLLALGFDKLDPSRYRGRLRALSDGRTSTMAVAMDFDRRIGIVFGSAYMGSMKKLMFTAMNYYLPDEGILPLHCSANEGEDGSVALFLGLSGTGKTTLSADPERALIGDDEHGWSNNGIANFEEGCYAKLINLDPEKEPEIYNATFHPDHYLSHGSLVENLMVYPDGTFDFDDDRFTPNSRASYPLRYVENSKADGVGGHPSTIFFLTADAYGVLPPIAKLNPEQAMLWFMMGYTSKLAGTETDVVEPKAAFSRFFGEPFMPRNPGEYADLLGRKMREHEADVYLLNTGWTGGPYGVGRRMDINATRAMVHAAVGGRLRSAEYRSDEVFKLQVPLQCPGVDDTLLNPRETWDDAAAFDQTARKLASQFAARFEKAFAGKVSEAVAAQCPRG